MVRKLVKTLLSLSLVAPAAALALGVGEVQLHSALNQRLDADIKLLSVDPAEADTIDVSLASYEDFAKVGLERPATLMFLRFNVEQTPGGDYYIKLTSKDAIREPFLDFLVEVKWRSGRVLREYTLLLDPPVTHRQAAPAIAAPSTGPAAAAVTAESKDEFVAPPSSIPVAPGVKAPTVSSGMMPAQATVPAGGIVYGPVKADDTLWRIAQKLRPNSDVSVQQMMVALLVANPYAFFDNNINRLKKGFVLRIDDPAVITAMNKAEAAREVSRQTRQWQDYRSSIAAKAEKRMAASAAESPAAAVGTANKEAKLELVAPEGKAEKPGAAGSGSESVQKDLMLALESSAAQRKENEELQKRVQGLEEQLKDMQRLLSLKDADLATLQSQLREQGQGVTLPSEKAEPSSAPLVVKSDETAKAETPAMGEAATTPQEKAPAEAVTKEKPAVVAPVEKPAPVKKPVVKKPVAQPVEEPSIVDMILGDQMMLAAGGGAVLLILVLLMVMIRRRRGGGFQESILSGGTSSMLGAKDEEGSSETSFLSDLAVSGMGGGAIHTDEGEVDPLTEADVFMAYGRNQQAEEVLQKALEKNPERHELTAKLLEVYYNLKDTDQFVTLAEESAEALKTHDDVWARVAGMGRELSPENSLFDLAEGAEAPAPKAPSGKHEPISEDVLDIGLDLDELTAEMESEGGGGDLGFDLGLDFGDLDEEEKAGADSEKKQEAAESLAASGSDLDFDLDLTDEEEKEAELPSDFDLDLGAESTEEAAPEATAGLEFDLGALEEEETPAADTAGEFELDLGAKGVAAEDEDISLDFDLGADAETESTEEEAGLELGDLDDIDFGDLGLEATTEESAPAAVSADEDELSLDMSALETAGAGDELEGLGDLGDLDDLGDLGDLDEEGLLGDSDEIATKLDLAQAYIEMGDSDGARSMLEEVAEAGNDDQKQQAQELLSKI